MRLFKCIAVSLAIAVSGCGGRAPLAPTQSEAVIIFILPGMTSASGQYQPTYGMAPTVTIHDVTRAERKIVAILGPGQKAAYRVPPGKHRFMLFTRISTDFMEANVVGGRTYYAVAQLQASTGYDQRYALRPVRPENFNNGSFGRWEHGTSYVARQERWEAWAKGNASSVDDRYRQHWPTWEKRSTEERALNSLNASDGR